MKQKSISKKTYQWIADNKYTTRRQMEKIYGKDSGYNINDFQEIEISVLRKNNKFGKRSYGWGGFDKIILFDGDGEMTGEEIGWWKRVAQTIADALNNARL